jgi:hypothetical protein
MNCDKAQELFSEFHEETLAEGLRLNVNRHFENCASCAADFTSFQRAYRSITEVNPPTAPDDLGEMIARRLDRVDFERKRSSARPLSWVRIGASAAAVAAVLTVALVYKPNSPRGAGASILPPIAEQAANLTVEKLDGSIRIRFIAREDTRVDVLEGGNAESILPPNDAKPIRVDTVRAGSSYDVPVSFEGPIPQPLWLKVTGMKETLGVFFPQPAVLTSRVFTGDVPQTLQALANGYGVVVEARLVGTGRPVKQNLEGTDVLEAAKTALQSTPYKQVSLANGVLHVR